MLWLRYTFIILSNKIDLNTLQIKTKKKSFDKNSSRRLETESQRLKIEDQT